MRAFPNFFQEDSALVCSLPALVLGFAGENDVYQLVHFSGHFSHGEHVQNPVFQHHHLLSLEQLAIVQVVVVKVNFTAQVWALTLLY